GQADGEVAVLEGGQRLEEHPGLHAAQGAALAHVAPFARGDVRAAGSAGGRSSDAGRHRDPGLPEPARVGGSDTLVRAHVLDLSDGRRTTTVRRGAVEARSFTRRFLTLMYKNTARSLGLSILPAVLTCAHGQAA